MNLPETALMLAQMQAYDQRTVGESDVIAWQALLADAPFEDCQEAVRRHYAEQTERIMPAHVRRIVQDIVKAREVSPWAPGQYGVRREDAMVIVEVPDRLALTDLPGPVANLVASVRAMMPEGSREALKPRTVAWEREQAAFRRQQAAEPNPLYRASEVRKSGDRVGCDWHEGGGYGWTWDCRECNPDHPAYRPGAGTPCFNREPHQAHPWRIDEDGQPVTFACPGIDE